MLLAPKQKERYLQSFLLGLLISGLFLGIFMIVDRGYFLYYGDFNVQQIPFYRLAHQAVKSGNLFWNWNTDLGVNFIGSYSFYMLGSPFFWLTIPFPNSFVPYLMGPLLMLKFACASLTAYCYIRQYTRHTHNALIGALLYAFSGFAVYNVFFNHFHEAIVFFPLLLLSFDQLVTKNRRGFFAFMVCVTAVSNYFFFCGMVVFLIIYWFIKLISKSWKLTFARFAWLVFEAVLGVIMAAFLLLPSYLAISDMSRVNGYLVGWDAVIYSEPQVFYNVIQSLFFPPDNPARLVFFPNNGYQWSSMSAWLPLFSMTGVIAWLQNKKCTWQKRMLTTCMIMALVPFLNSAFYMFNYSYYARWFYMPILIMALVSAQALEEPDINWASAFRWSIGITVAITLVVGLMPSLHTAEDGFSKFGLFKEAQEGNFFTVRFWVECLIAIFSLVVFLLLMLYRSNIAKRKDEVPLGKRISEINARSNVFWRACVGALCAITVLYSGIHIGWGKTHSNDEDYLIDNLINGSINLDINEGERVDVYEGTDNTAMYLGFPTIQAFHSIVPKSVFDFYDFVGVERSVGSRPDTTNHEIRGLLSVRYLLDYNEEPSFTTPDINPDLIGTMPGWSYVRNENDHAIFKNDYYIPYGFTYDYCISAKTVQEQYDCNEAGVMLKAIVLDRKDIKKYSSILTEITDDSLYFNGGFGNTGYIESCEERRATSKGNTIHIDNNGFTAEVTLDRENLVFYSVPYDEGWSVTVDGKKADVIKANIGFMAVAVPEGTHTIRFNYYTPGLKLGITLTIASIVVFAVYLLLFSLYKKHHPDCMTVCDPYRAELESKWAEFDAAELAYNESVESGEKNEEAEVKADAEAEAISEQNSEPELIFDDENFEIPDIDLSDIEITEDDDE